MKRSAWLVGLAAAALPFCAQAAPGVVTEPSFLLAGPGNYPNVAAVPGGAKVDVIGCTSSYSWCDVSFGLERGWVTGTRLVLPYQGRETAVVDVGPRVSVPIVAFEVGPYWEAHYRDRPFYSERDRWAQLREEQRMREAANGVR